MRTLTDTEALDYASRAARSAFRTHPDTDAWQDAACEALYRLAERAGGQAVYTDSGIAATVRHLWQEYVGTREDRAAKRTLSLDTPAGSDTEAQTHTDRLAAPTEAFRHSGRILSEDIAGGYRLSVTQDAYGLDSDSAVLTDSDGKVVATGSEAGTRAQALRLSAARGTAHGAATQVVSASVRDAAVLSVYGLPWQDALEALAAQGIVLTRGALREAQRVARRRLDGLTARN